MCFIILEAVYQLLHVLVVQSLCLLYTFSQFCCLCLLVNIYVISIYFCFIGFIVVSTRNCDQCSQEFEQPGAPSAMSQDYH